MKTFRVRYFYTHQAERFVHAESVEHVEKILGITEDNRVITDEDQWGKVKEEGGYGLGHLIVEQGWVQDQIIDIKDEED
tara:strand:- start:157 stop:393 length:237 start_codon:yes stop_codon:yes gene_type:complete